MPRLPHGKSYLGKLKHTLSVHLPFVAQNKPPPPQNISHSRIKRRVYRHPRVCAKTPFPSVPPINKHKITPDFAAKSQLGKEIATDKDQRKSEASRFGEPNFTHASSSKTARDKTARSRQNRKSKVIYSALTSRISPRNTLRTLPRTEQYNRRKAENQRQNIGLWRTKFRSKDRIVNRSNKRNSPARERKAKDRIRSSAARNSKNY